MGVDNLLTAALKKGDQEDILVLKNGKELSLGQTLPYKNGAELVIHIVLRREHVNGDDRILAKHILQEILNGED